MCHILATQFLQQKLLWLGIRLCSSSVSLFGTVKIAVIRPKNFIENWWVLMASVVLNFGNIIFELFACPLHFYAPTAHSTPHSIQSSTQSFRGCLFGSRDGTLLGIPACIYFYIYRIPFTWSRDVFRPVPPRRFRLGDLGFSNRNPAQATGTTWIFILTIPQSYLDNCFFILVFY